MRDLSAELWRKRAEPEPALYSIGFPRKAQPEPETDDQRELHAEVSALVCPPCRGNCQQGRTCPGRAPIKSVEQELPWLWLVYAVAIVATVVACTVSGVMS